MARAPIGWRQVSRAFDSLRHKGSTAFRLRGGAAPARALEGAGAAWAGPQGRMGPSELPKTRDPSVNLYGAP